MLVVHILNEPVSPPEALIWTMLCGDQCIAKDDGELIPEMDFVGPRDAEQATCRRCIDTHALCHERAKGVTA